jgi:hypothetical protein
MAFPSLFSEAPHFRISVYIYSKSKEQWKIFKTLSGSSPIFALSIHTTFNQTQTDATVPLRVNFIHIVRLHAAFT